MNKIFKNFVILMYNLLIEFEDVNTLLLLCNGYFMASIFVKHNPDDLDSLLKLIQTLPNVSNCYGNIFIENASTLTFDQGDSGDNFNDIAIPMDTPGLKEALYKMYNSLNSRE